MQLETYLQQLPEPLRPRTLSFLLKDDKALFGHKKSGFGKDKVIGIGGKVEEGETIEEAMIREDGEEIFVKPLTYRKVAVLKFLFPHAPEPKKWNQEVHVFLVDTWEGEPTESDEIRPEWFDLNNIPYDRTWDDYQYWLPKVLAGEYVEAAFLFDAELKVEEHVFY